jgi:shikimate dehydrogenase
MMKRNKLGLIGLRLTHSFSKEYFIKVLPKKGLDDWQYDLFEIPSIEDAAFLLERQDVLGLNVTIPYKQAILPFLNEIDQEAKEVGAVNTLVRTSKGWKGYNTDIIGFEKSYEQLALKKRPKVLIFGTGATSRSMQYVFNKLGIEFVTVSRNPEGGSMHYMEIDKSIMKEFTMFINTTPVGMYPHVESMPFFPYHLIKKHHVLYDVHYNPFVSMFLKEGLRRGCVIKNGYQMLKVQADASLRLWVVGS